MSYRIITILILNVAILCLGLFNLGHVDLQFWDEATNLAVMVESSQSSDLWNLRFNGQYFWEKPPLYYWAGIIIYKLFNPDSYRFVLLMRGFSVIAAVLLVNVVYLYLKKFHSERSAWFAYIIPLTIPSLWLFNPNGVFATHHFRSVDSDIWQLLFIMLGIYLNRLLANKLQTRPELNKSNISLAILAAFCSGLGVMVKGVFGLLPVFVWVVLCVHLFVKTVDKKRISLFLTLAKLTLIQLCCLLIIVLPWHIYMYLSFGTEFIDEYLIYHQFNRAGTALEGHDKPFMFYFNFLLNPRTSGILLLFLSAVLLVTTRQYVMTRRFKLFASLELFLGLLFLFVFSLIQTKISWYSLYPAIFLMIATCVYLGEISQLGRLRCILVFLFVPILLTINALRQLPENTYTSSDYRQTNLFLTSREPHRNFLYQQLQGDGEIALLSDAQPDTLYLVDRHELVEIRSGLNYKELRVKRLSPNYATLIYN